MSDVPTSAGAAASGEAAPLGCLSAEQVHALAAMEPGEIPGEIARHLAGCERCQRLALFGEAQTTARRVANPPSLRRAFLLVGIILVALIVFLISLQMLAG
jgi:hypothetical protein